ncbi:hypothetical protein VTK73DRAFT_3472 [Phialemonium thermophilum]|uniref:Uncharacterized protein n=1 Tax=Phialemonium thermophilum TaxID=223376 RepID=A0ABR3WZH8_9PEZI
MTYYDDDPNYIEDCKALVDLARVEFSKHDTILISSNPEKILEDPGRNAVALYAQYIMGDLTYVFMRSPRILRFLENLASNGIGYSDIYRDVRFKFILIPASCPLYALEADVQRGTRSHQLSYYNPCHPSPEMA